MTSSIKVKYHMFFSMLPVYEMKWWIGMILELDEDQDDAKKNQFYASPWSQLVVPLAKSE